MRKYKRSRSRRKYVRRRKTIRRPSYRRKKGASTYKRFRVRKTLGTIRVGPRRSMIETKHLTIIKDLPYSGLVAALGDDWNTMTPFIHAIDPTAFAMSNGTGSGNRIGDRVTSLSIWLHMDILIPDINFDWSAVPVNPRIPPGYFNIHDQMRRLRLSVIQTKEMGLGILGYTPNFVLGLEAPWNNDKFNILMDKTYRVSMGTQAMGNSSNQSTSTNWMNTHPRIITIKERIRYPGQITFDATNVPIVPKPTYIVLFHDGSPAGKTNDGGFLMGNWQVKNFWLRWYYKDA